MKKLQSSLADLVNRFPVDDRSIRQFRRYFIVGLSNAVIFYLLFTSFYALQFLHPGRGAVAQGGAHAVVLMWSYFWNRRWSFESSNKIGREGTRYIVEQAMLLVLGVGLIGLSVDTLSLPKTPSWIVVNAVLILMNFALLKYWVFRERPMPPS